MRRALAVMVPLLIAGVAWVSPTQPRVSPATAIVHSHFGLRHPELMRDLLARPGVSTKNTRGVELYQATHVFTGPWVGVPANFPARGKTVVMYGCHGRRDKPPAICNCTWCWDPETKCSQRK